jgi:hypothetical protein
MWVKLSPAASASSSHVLMALAGVTARSTATGTVGQGQRPMYTVADAELAMVLEEGHLVVWIKGVRYDAARAARGPIFEGPGDTSSVSSVSPLEPRLHYRGGVESKWREVVAPGQWSLLAITFEAAPDVGPSGYPHTAATAPPPSHPLPPPAGAVVGDGVHYMRGGGGGGGEGGAAGDGGGGGKGGLKLSVFVDGKAVQGLESTL